MTLLNFHVRHEVTPDRVWSVLDSIAANMDYSHITQSDRQISRLRQLGLLSGKGTPQLTEDGVQLHRIGQRRIDLVWELLHFMHYSRWRQTDPTSHTMFFTYFDYCNLLYEGKIAQLDTERNRLAAEITQRIVHAPCFADSTAELARGAVSLSKNSLAGIEHWLARLSPEVISSSRFELRHYCPPELLLMALGLVTEMTGAQIGVEQPLTDDRRELLCRVCLLNDEVLNQMLDWLYPEYPDFVQPGTGTGSYGLFVRLMKQPSLKDIAL